jgi:hypothetical protein
MSDYLIKVLSTRIPVHRQYMEYGFSIWINFCQGAAYGVNSMNPAANALLIPPAENLTQLKICYIFPLWTPASGGESNHLFYLLNILKVYYQLKT